MTDIADRVIDNIRFKNHKVLWAASVCTQDEVSNDLFHAMGQFVAMADEEEKVKQFVISKAMEKFPKNRLVSCKAIPISQEAIAEVLK